MNEEIFELYPGFVSVQCRDFKNLSAVRFLYQNNQVEQHLRNIRVRVLVAAPRNSHPITHLPSTSACSSFSRHSILALYNAAIHRLPPIFEKLVTQNILIIALTHLESIDSVPTIQEQQYIITYSQDH